jgi:hypothetical protein
MALQYADYTENEGVADMGETSENDLLGPSEAAAYLAHLWQRPFTAKDFANLRTNHQLSIEPAYSTARITMWRRGSLKQLAESMEPPRLREEIRKPRRKRK